MIKHPISNIQLMIKQQATGKLLTTSDQQFKIIIFTEREQLLGKGAFGKCYIGILQSSSSSTKYITQQERNQQDDQQVRYNHNHSIVVVKEIKKDKEKPIQQQSLYKRQIENLSFATKIPSISKNIVKCFPFMLTSENNYYMVMEYCEGKSLDKLITKRLKACKWFNFYQFLKILSDIVSGYYPLNKLMIMHEDLKPQNIFIKGKEFKIGDFGLSFVIKGQQQFSRGGSLSYNGKQKYSKSIASHKSDMYAIGIILFKLFYRYHPYFQETDWKRYRDQQINRIMKLGHIKTSQIKINKSDDIKMFLRFYETRKLKKFDPLVSKPQQRQELKGYSAILKNLYQQEIPKLISKLIEKQINSRPSFTQLNMFIKKNKINEILKQIQETLSYYEKRIQLFEDLSSEVSNTIKLSGKFDNLKEKICIEPCSKIYKRDFEVQTDMLRTAGNNKQRKGLLMRKYPRVFELKYKVESVNNITRQFMNIYEELNQLDFIKLFSALKQKVSTTQQQQQQQQQQQLNHNYELIFYQDKKLQVQFVIQKYIYSFLLFIQKQFDQEANKFNKDELEIFYQENVDFVMELVDKNKEYLESELFISKSDQLVFQKCEEQLERIIVDELIGLITLDERNLVLVYQCICILKIKEFIAQIKNSFNNDLLNDNNNKKKDERYVLSLQNNDKLQQQFKSQRQTFINQRNTFTKFLNNLSSRRKGQTLSQEQLQRLQCLKHFIRKQLDRNNIHYMESID